MARAPASVVARQLAAAREERLQAALVAVRAHGVRTSGRTIYSLHQAARDYGVPKATLTARYCGRLTHHQASQTQQCLTTAQETVLVNWIKQCGARGMGLTRAAVMEAASLVSGHELGERWYTLFLRRNYLDIRGRWASGLEAPRAQCLNRLTVEQFFLLLEALIEQYAIVPECIHNMDEKGLMMGLGQRSFVLVDRNQATANVIEDGNRELVTMIECICADGTTLTPTAIFKGARRDLEWGRNNPLNIRFVMLFLCFQTKSNLMPASAIHRKAGPIMTLHSCGSQMTLSLRHARRPMDAIGSSSSMGTLHTSRIGSANLLHVTRSSSCVFLLTLHMSYNLAIAVFSAL
jgi:hypothetical protein